MTEAVGIFLAGVATASIGQVMKRGALRGGDRSNLRPFLDPYVIEGYTPMPVPTSPRSPPRSLCTVRLTQDRPLDLLDMGDGIVMPLKRYGCSTGSIPSYSRMIHARVI